MASCFDTHDVARSNWYRDGRWYWLHRDAAYLHFISRCRSSPWCHWQSGTWLSGMYPRREWTTVATWYNWETWCEGTNWMSLPGRRAATHLRPAWLEPYR